MANRFQQKALLRKVVYLVLILVLLTASLMHRRMIVVPQAYNLQLREEARGAVDLTSSAVQLTLTGSRGLTTCILWLAAIEKQKRHEWNEMDLLVRSITKVQPYFVSPWLFQSWNLSFNVAVECDRVNDKYFYISRGLELLAEGERRNQGGDVLLAGESKRLRFPGNPEMRFYMGFTYQLKIGQGDDQDYLRCLFNMSCIDPADRDPDSLMVVRKEGEEVDLVKFEQFCKKYPRLVRRLRESVLAFDTPRDIVNFLRFNKDVPSRYEKPHLIPGAEPQRTPFKPLTERFPILPPPNPAELAQYSPRDRDKIDDVPADEDFDVYSACRAWYTYAQEPLPPPNPDPGVHDEQFARRNLNPMLHRLPKMSQHIFRGYPARAQAYHVENLQKEGWFDADGWLVKGWFDQLPGRSDAEVRVGTERKYHTAPAWETAYGMYKDYGIQNGLYLTTSERRRLKEEARPFLQEHGVDTAHAPDRLTTQDRQKGLEASHDAAMKLKWNTHYRTMTNFDNFLTEADVERRPETVAARKAFFQAERLRLEAANEQALRMYEAVMPRWLDVLLAHLDFARLPTVQEETYEVQMQYLRLFRNQHDARLKPIVTGVAQLALQLGFTPLPLPLHETKRYQEDLAPKLIIAMRTVSGPFERVYYFERPNLETLREVLFDATQGAVQPPLLLSPALKMWMLRRTLVLNKPREETRRRARQDWQPLLPDAIIQQVRERLGIWRPPAAPAPAARPPARK